MATAERARTAPQAPPQNLDAEESVLGALLLGNGKVIDNVLDTGLAAAHFYRETHGQLFDVAVGLHGKGRPVSPITLADELEVCGLLEQVGGKLRVHELAALVPATANAAAYARIVLELATLRNLIRVGGDIARLGWERPADTGELVEQAGTLMVEFQARLHQGRRTVVPSTEAAAYVTEKVANPLDESAGVAVPFRFLPRLQPSRLYVLGGYAKDGKTALAIQFLRAAAEAGSRVGFVTLEMSWRDLTDRIVASFGVPYRQAQTGRVQGPYLPLVERATGALDSWNVDLIDNELASAAAIRRYQRLGRYELLVIDHLHRIDWQERRELEREVKTITSIAREAEIPVLLLAQFHRPVGRDDFPRPTMQSFRESGVIEQEASVACAVWRKRDPESRLPTDEAELIVLANRYGRAGKWNLAFRPAEVRFVEVSAA